MKTFKSYVIAEKINHQEISQALSDNNLMCGIEYEFILDDDIREENIPEVLEEYEKLCQDMIEAQETIDEYRFKISDILEQIRKDTLKYYKMIGDMDSYEQIEDMSHKDMIYHRDDYDWTEEIPEEEELIDAVFSNEIPQITDSSYSNYVAYVEHIFGLNYNDANEAIFYYVANKEYNTPERALEVGGLYSPEDNLDIVPDADKWRNYFMTKSGLPFNPRQAEYLDVGSYGSSNKWSVGSDQSLHPSYGTGCEISSPVKNIGDALKDMEKMFNFISDNGYTTNDCGLHINLSYKGKSFTTDSFDYLKCMLFMEEDKVWQEFRSRKDNPYTRSVLDFIESVISKNGKNAGAVPPAMKDIYNKFRKEIEVPNGKYFGVNISNSWSRIEFRYLGGANYEDSANRKKIIQTISKYAVMINLGFDENFKKREYIQKLTRLYNRLVDESGIPRGAVSDNTGKMVRKRGKFLVSTTLDFHGTAKGRYKIVCDIYMFKGQIYAIEDKTDKVIEVLNKSDKRLISLDVDNISMRRGKQ